jgi:DNA-binding CsgD family transcriptional regulator/tetratricopeptide (TPR) repeat protein
MARRVSSPILVGRDRELRAFDLALDDALVGRPTLVVVGGEAGIGKSRLVSEFAGMTRARGGVAVVGMTPATAGLQGLPLAALAQALRSLIRSVDARLIDHLLGAARADLAALLPELGEPAQLPAPAPFAAVRLAEAVLVAIESVATRQPPLMLALEDLQWMDDATRATILYVCRSLVDAPAAVVLTYRTDDPRGMVGLPDLLAEVGRSRDVERLELEPLDPGAVAELVEAIRGPTAPGDDRAEVVRRSGGNPYFVEELLLASGFPGQDRAPASVRLSVESRLARLSPSALALVQVAAASGRAVGVELLREMTGLPRAALADAIDEARGSHLIVPTSDGAAARAGAYEIRHVLSAEAILEGMSAMRREDLHRRIAVILERRHELAGDNELERTAALARHWTLAGEAARALPAVLAEAAAAEGAHAFSAAARAYRVALEMWPRTADGTPQPSRISALPDEGVVLERAAHACSLAGQAESAIALAERALSTPPVAGASEDPERTARLTMHLARFQAEAGHRLEAVANARAAVAASWRLSPLHVRGRILLARLLSEGGEDAAALEMAATAVDLATRIAAGELLAQAQTTLAVMQARMGRSDEALATLAAAQVASPQVTSAPLPSRPSRLVADLLGFLDRARVLEQAGDLEAAAAVAREGVLLARERGLASTQGALLAAVAARDLLHSGTWEEAAQVARIGSAGDGATVAEVALVSAHLAVRRGEWHEAEAVLATVRASGETLERGWGAYPALVAAEMAWWRRRHLEAGEAIALGSAIAEAGDEPETLLTLALLGLRNRTDALLTSGRRRGVDAAAALGSADPHLVRLTAASQRSHRSPATLRESALLATAAAELLRWQDSRPERSAGVSPLVTGAMPLAGATTRSWEDAVRAWEAAGDPYEAAYCRWRLAEALVGDHDRVAARAQLRAVMGVAERLTAAPLAREAEALARRARLVEPLRSRPAHGGSTAPVRTGEWQARELGLSERETEVLGLLAEGLTDREIGERLFITTKTAGHHVSHILAKLSLDRRGEAAALAFRLGLTGPLE